MKIQALEELTAYWQYLAGCTRWHLHGVSLNWDQLKNKGMGFFFLRILKVPVFSKSMYYNLFRCQDAIGGIYFT